MSAVLRLFGMLWEGSKPARPRRAAKVGLVVVLLVLPALVAWPSLDNRFSLDDHNWLARAEFRTSAGSFVLEPEPGQLFQPVSRAFFLALYEISGGGAMVYRAAVLALHCLNVLLLFVLGAELTGRREVGCLAALLFGLQPAYHEALFWVAAFFHPLATSCYLAACLLALSTKRPGTGLRRALFVLAVAAGCLVKASFFTLPVVVALLVWGRGPRSDEGQRWWPVLVAAVLVVVALVVNVGLGISDSYLLERGIYRPGAHVFGNLIRYVGILIVPWDGLLGRVGLGAAVPAARALAGLIGLGFVAVLILTPGAGRRVRALAASTLVTLLPFLPFVSEPTSRYCYLPSAFAALLVATLVFRLWPQPTRRALPIAILTGLALAAVADSMVRDSTYRHRERQIEFWVLDVARALPEEPADQRITILGLPRLAVDRGIHLEAALQLHYDDPSLRLLTEAPDRRPRGRSVLVFDQGRIRPAEESSGRLPGRISQPR